MLAPSLTSLQHLLLGNRVSFPLQWVGLFFGLNQEGLSDGLGSACVDTEHKARQFSIWEHKTGWVKPQSSLSSNLALQVGTAYVLWKIWEQDPHIKFSPRRLSWAPITSGSDSWAGGGDLHWISLDGDLSAENLLGFWTHANFGFHSALQVSVSHASYFVYYFGTPSLGLIFYNSSRGDLQSPPRPVAACCC